MSPTFNFQKYLLVTLVVSFWIHASEVFRYFVFVTPQLRTFLSESNGIAPMSLGIFFVWGVWDMLLTGLTVYVFWIYAQKYGNNRRSVIASGTLAWALFFLLFWIGMVNMGLSSVQLLAIALPLSWFELVVACWIASKMYRA